MLRVASCVVRVAWFVLRVACYALRVVNCSLGGMQIKCRAGHRARRFRIAVLSRNMAGTVAGPTYTYGAVGMRSRWRLRESVQFLFFNSGNFIVHFNFRSAVQQWLQPAEQLLEIGC